MSGPTDIHAADAPWPCLAVYDELTAAFDAAYFGDSSQRIATTTRLKRAIAAGAALGDFGGLPCRLSIWMAALHWLDGWADASDAQRPTYASAAYGIVTALNSLRLAAKAGLADAPPPLFTRADLEG